jgi:hypothetical protein
MTCGSPIDIRFLADVCHFIRLKFDQSSGRVIPNSNASKMLGGGTTMLEQIVLTQTDFTPKVGQIRGRAILSAGF